MEIAASTKKMKLEGSSSVRTDASIEVVATKLYSRNKEVDNVNALELANLNGIGHHIV